MDAEGPRRFDVESEAPAVEAVGPLKMAREEASAIKSAWAANAAKQMGTKQMGTAGTQRPAGGAGEIRRLTKKLK